MSYENLCDKAEKIGAKIIELDLGTNKACGKCIDDLIFLNSNMTSAEKKCVLAEELGHYFITYGDITNQSKICNKKQELIARRKGYSLIIEPIDFIYAFRHGVVNRHELAEFLNVTESVLLEIIEDFKRKYGTGYQMGKYYLNLEPYFGVIELF